jgi:hypothetical protein
MKKNMKSKLPLRTETVRLLSQQELSQVAGGNLTAPQSNTNPLTARCTVSCAASKPE